MRSSCSSKGVTRWGSRALALTLGVLFSLLLLEGVLRVAGIFVEGSRVGAVGEAGILCQGDSFTFGLFLPPEAAYPARLEALLHANGEPGARVVNAGIPSKPTWIVKKELRADLRRWKPRIVLMLAGVNDRWRLRPDDHAVEVRGAAPRPWRIVKTWQWLVARSGSKPPADTLAPQQEQPSVPVVEAEHDSTSAIDDHGITNWMPTTAVKSRPGVQEVRFRDRAGGARGFDILAGAPEVEEYCGWIEEDMTTAIAIAREEGVVPVLLAYPATGVAFDPVNATLERVASRTNTLFIDPRPEFAIGMQRVGKGALFFPDLHATDAGCALMARVALRELAKVGLVRVDQVPAPLGVLEGWVEPRLSVVVEPAPPGVRPSHVQVEYASGYGSVLFLSRAVGETLIDFPTLGDVQRVPIPRGKTRKLPLEHDALLQATLTANQFRTVTIGADGKGRLPIPWDALDSVGGGDTIYAAVAIVLPKVGPVIVVSEAVAIPLPKD